MILYGSITSPYVRRLRLLLEAHNTDYDFVDMQIFTPKDREMLAQRNPTLKIPMLEVDGEVIFDSRVIYRHLADKLTIPALSLACENTLTLIDAANDSLVQMLLLARSDIDITANELYFATQRERVDAVFTNLDALAEKNSFCDWDYPTICLFCLIDWTLFRNMHNVEAFSGLMHVHQKYKRLTDVVNTDPRRSS